MMKTDILCTKIQTFLLFCDKKPQHWDFFLLYFIYGSASKILQCFIYAMLFSFFRFDDHHFSCFFFLTTRDYCYFHPCIFFFFFFNFLSSRNCCWMNLHGRNDRIGFAKYSSQFSVSFVFFDIRDFHWMMFSKAFFSLFQAFFMSEFDFFLSKSWGKSKILIKRNVLRWF